jgi:Ni/Co efflux regulator RcnB
MKSMLMAIMAVAVAVTFSAPAFAGDEKTEKKDEKKGSNVLVYGDEKKDEKKDGKYTDTFEEKKDEKKKDEKGK